MATQVISVPTKSMVLIVDDDPAVRNSLKFALEVEGFSVQVYPTGVDLLDEHDLPASGCLVTDYNLPGMNGLDLLDLLRERDIKMPAILITTHPSAVIRRRAASAGVPLIEKPLLNDTLFQCIRSALGDDLQHH
jgi:FixJ family two-component response regulator